MSTITIRLLEQNDWSKVWSFLEPVFRTGETYTFDREISESQAFHTWVEIPQATFVAEAEDHTILGTYYLKPNQGGGGAHVCNCGYVVAPNARGRGVAFLMCQHSQSEAQSRNFRAMQFNFVVSTNVGAIRLWQRHSFEIIGKLPNAFKHPVQGYVDAFVMYKELAT